MNDSNDPLTEAMDTIDSNDGYNGIYPGESYWLENNEKVFVVDRSGSRFTSVQLIIENEAGDRKKLSESRLIQRIDWGKEKNR